MQADRAGGELYSISAWRVDEAPGVRRSARRVRCAAMRSRAGLFLTQEQVFSL